MRTLLLAKNASDEPPQRPVVHKTHLRETGTGRPQSVERTNIETRAVEPGKEPVGLGSG